MHPLKRRITQSTIEDMARTLTSRKYAAKQKELGDQQKALADKMYVEHLGAEVCESMQALPEGWLPTTHTLRFKIVDAKGNNAEIPEVARSHNRYSQNRKSSRMSNRYTIGLSSPQRVPCYMQYGTAQYLEIRKDDPALLEQLALDEQLTDLEIEREDFNDQMTNIITEARSFHRLYEQWPEVRELVKQYEPSDTPQPKLLPALPIAQLNAELGIPEVAA